MFLERASLLPQTQSFLRGCPSSLYRLVSRVSSAQLPWVLFFGLTSLAMFFDSAALAGANTNSQDSSASLKQLSLKDLGNIEVTTVSKEPERMQQVPAAIYVLRQEDIRRSGATSIPEALRFVPGVEVARIDSDHWAVGIRGFGSEFSKAVLMLIDGRSVYSPLFAGVYWNVENVMLEDVDRIEVIRGPGGTIWGANAFNGVINIITKNSSETRGLFVSTSGGDVDQGAGAFRYGAGNSNGFSFRLYGMAFARAAQFHPDAKPFDERQMGQGGFRTDWHSPSGDTLTIQGNLYRGYTGERVSMSRYSPPSATIFDDAHNAAGGNVLGRWRHRIDNRSDLQLQSYWDRTSRLSPQLDEIRNTLDVDFLYHLHWNARHDFLLGAGGRWSPDNITQKFATLGFLRPLETDSIYSWFAQDQIAMLPNKLFLTVGSKFEHNDYSGFEIQPNARVMWTPTANQSLWAAVTRAVRTPSRLDQDLQLTESLTPNPPIFLRVAGSKSFQSEQL